jgi:DNA-binding SARP family transcriptional activator
MTTSPSTGSSQHVSRVTARRVPEIENTPAKITSPGISDLVPRKRLFELLDACFERPVTWISAPAGSGKTTLAASYLSVKKLPHIWYRVDEGDCDIASFFYYMGLAAKRAAPGETDSLPLLAPEYMRGIPTFTLRYFENLYCRLKAPFVIVLDNYHHVPAGAQFHEVISKGLEVLTEGITFLILSREHPPPQLSRFRVGRNLSSVTAADIAFDLDESREMICLRGLDHLADETVCHMHERTKGWVAGLVLMTESGGQANGQSVSVDTPQELFDYFATEILERTDHETRRFLVKTSLLPDMTEKIAGKLTGAKGCCEILNRLSRNHFFTEKGADSDPIYRYHPLFREFLLSRAEEELSRGEIVEILQCAAILFMQAGRQEDAAGFYLQSEDWSGFVPFVIEHAPALMAQGRIHTLRDWISRIPDGMVENTPWLLYWLGMAEFYFNPEKSRRDLEKAFKLFTAMNDDAGALKSWSCAVDTFMYTFDDFRPLDCWIAWLTDRIHLNPSFPTPDLEACVASSMVSALVWRQPDHPELSSWVHRAFSSSRTMSDTSVRLLACRRVLHHHIWFGDLDGSRIVLEDMERICGSGEVPPAPLIATKMIQAHYWALLGNDGTHALELASDGIRMGEETGIHIVDLFLLTQGGVAALARRDHALAEDFIRKLSTTTPAGCSTCFTFWLISMQELLRGDIPQALAFSGEMLYAARRCGTPFPEAWAHLLIAQAAFEDENHSLAYTELAAAEEFARKTGSMYFEFACCLVRTYFTLTRRRQSSGLQLLRRALKIGREHGFTNTPLVDRPDVWSFLCATALEAGMEIEYAQELIRGQRLHPHAQAMNLENWPWPVKIYTLGGFRLLVDGKPVTFAGKVQKKPLEMLMCIVSLGGKNIAREQLTDLLWPDSDGDQAQSAFNTTVSRLRSILGTNEALAIKGGRVSLNPRYCRVDTWTLDDLVQRMDALWTAMSGSGKGGVRETAQWTALMENAVRYYVGPFLPEEDRPWVLTARRILRKKFNHLVSECGTRLETTGAGEKAAALYRKAIESDDTVDEEIYRRLMAFHMERGDSFRTMELYGQCRKMLAVTLGITPSAKTEEVCRKLRQPRD